MMANTLDKFKKRISQNFADVEVVERDLGNGAVMAILRGGLNSGNPRVYMDNAVSEYVGHDMYNEFVEIFMDNSWVRVLIFEFNNINDWKSFAHER